MNTQALIGSMQDTLSFSYGPVLRNRTQKAAESSRVYEEGFVSPKTNTGEGEILLQEIGTLEAAQINGDLGKVAVLNFANGEEPCGGARQGTNTQEEYLCRNTNLYHCLTRPQLLEPFYGYHRARGQSSDRVIYTQGITVFKDGAPVPDYLAHKKWYEIDVLTCAAPSMEETPHLGEGAREVLFRGRIRNICETARDNEVQVLILGAFGCGAFGNPPLVVAQAFHKVLVEEGCRNYFRRVVFAILKSDEADPNYAAFSQVFLGRQEEEDLEENALTRWQRGNPWYKKQISILGDSISTLEGFQARKDSVYYKGEIQEKTGVCRQEDTWWGQVISHFGADLLVNDSYSGRMVVPQETEPAAYSFRRTGTLHMEDLLPQGIFIYLGINDWMHGIPVAQFRQSYGELLEKLHRDYPEAVLWCCTLCETQMSAAPHFTFPKAFGGVALAEYNEAILEAAKENGAVCLDLYSQNTPYDSVDGLHPNRQGMRTLALGILKATVDSAGSVLLPLERVELPERKDPRKENASAYLGKLETAMESFYASDYRDCISFQTVLFYCPKVPLYFPGGEGGSLLKITSKLGQVIAAFTSEQEAEKGSKVHLLRLWPEEYLPLVKNENCPVVINPFCDSRFVIPQRVFEEVVAPAIETDPDCVLVPEPGQALLGKVLEDRFLCEKRLSVEGRNAVLEVRDQEKGIKLELWCIDTVTPGLEEVWEKSLDCIARRMELRHPNIQQYPTMFRAGQYLCILRQRADGILMQDAMKTRIRLPQILTWGRELASALSYLEQKNLLLTNLSPKRILIHHNHIRLCDFCGVVPKDGVIPAPRGIARGYAPKEGLQESKSHVYTVGMILYHLLTGMDPNEPGFTYCPLAATKLERHFAQAIDRCLLVEPEGRFKDCEALAKALEEVTL